MARRNRTRSVRMYQATEVVVQPGKRIVTSVVAVKTVDMDIGIGMEDPWLCSGLVVLFVNVVVDGW